MTSIRIVGRLFAGMHRRVAATVVAAIAIAAPGVARAADTNVAVAANFTEPAKEIAQLFEGKTGHKAIYNGL